MEQEFIAQTTLDQMVGNDQEQLLKALIPYLPQRHQSLFSLYAKALEFSNTVALFQNRQPTMQAASLSGSPLDLLNDVRQYCFGKSKDMLDQMVNMIAMVEMLKMMNSATPVDGCENERQ